MRNLLTRGNLAHVARMVGDDGILAFDFDGTLAPIVDVPSAAAMRDATRELLAMIGALRPVVIITGRSVADVTPRLRGVPTAAIVGNHGVEPSTDMAAARRTVAAWRELLDAAVGRLPGVVVEDKTYSVAVHYRHAPSPVAVRDALADACRRLGDSVRVVEGIALLNLIPAGAPTKGDAVRRIQADLAARVALYAGDEVTDEDAFAVLDDARSAGVRIGRAPRSSARFYLPRQDDVDIMLRYLLAALRGGAPGRRSRAALSAAVPLARD